MANAKVTVEGSSNVGGVVSQDLGKANASLTEFEKHGKKAGGAASEAGGSIDALSGTIQKLGQAIAAAGIVKLATELGQLGGASLRLNDSLDALTENQADEYIAAVGEASLGTISRMDAMGASSRALTLGVVDSADEMGQLTEAAIVLGRALGVDATKAMDDLVTGLGRGSRMILDNLGIMLEQTEIQTEVNRLMSENGSLTEAAAEKQAMFNLVMAQANALLAAQGGLHLDAMGSQERLAASVDNLKVSFGEMLAEAAVEPLDWAAEQVESAAQANTTLQDLKESYHDARLEIARTSTSYEEFNTRSEALNAQLADQHGMWMVSIDDLATGRNAYRGLLEEIGASEAAIETSTTTLGAHAVEAARTADSYEEWRASMVDAVSELSLLEQIQATIESDWGRAAYEDAVAAAEALDAEAEAAQRASQEANELNHYTQLLADTQRQAAEAATQQTTTLEQLVEGFNEAAAAVQAYVQIMEQQSALQLELIQQVPEFMAGQAGLADVFGLGVSALDNYNLTASDTLRLYQELGLATGQVTQAQIAQSEAMLVLDNLWIAGHISASQYADSLAAIQAGADAATVSQQALGQAAQDFLDSGAATTMQDAFAMAADAASGGADAALATAEEAMAKLNELLAEAPESIETEFLLNSGDALAQLQDLNAQMAAAREPVDLSITAPAVPEVTTSVTELGEAAAAVGLMDVELSIDTTAKEATGDVNGLKGAATNAEGTYTMIFNIVQNGDIPVAPGGAGADGKAVGGPISAGTPYLVGEQGPELILPSANGYVLTASETSALMAGSQGAGAGGGGGTIINGLSVVLPGVQNAADFLPELERELRTLGKGFATLGVAA